MSANPNESDSDIPSLYPALDSSELEPPISLDPDLENLVNSLVETRLQSSRQHLDEIRRREEELAIREHQIRQTIESLNVRASASEHISNQLPALNFAPEVTRPIPPANAPRKRRRQSMASVPDVKPISPAPAPPTSPARNTRSTTRANASSLELDLLTNPPTTPPKRSNRRTSTSATMAQSSSANPVAAVVSELKNEPTVSPVTPRRSPRTQTVTQSPGNRSNVSMLSPKSRATRMQMQSSPRASVTPNPHSTIQSDPISEPTQATIQLIQSDPSSMPLLPIESVPASEPGPVSQQQVTHSNQYASGIYSTHSISPLMLPTNLVSFRTSPQHINRSSLLPPNLPSLQDIQRRRTSHQTIPRPSEIASGGSGGPYIQSTAPATQGQGATSTLLNPTLNERPVIRPGPALTSNMPPVQRASIGIGQRRQAATKSARQVHRLLAKEMPDDMGGLKKAMDLHIRILWGLLDAKETPRNPPARLLSSFAQRFTTEAQLYLSQESGPQLIPLHLIQIGTKMSSKKGGIAREARLVEENILCHVQACLSRFGLDCWCPDLRQTAYSIYNSACRIIAIDTFKQALVSHAYMHLNPNTKYASNMDLLIKLYDHFVFSYMLDRYRKETRKPGSVEQDLRNAPQYMARKRLADARLLYLAENHYPMRYRQLINAKATSDDEFDETTKVYFIKRRPERSQQAERFIRLLDIRRERYAKQQQSSRWRERTRIVPAEQKDSSFQVLPDNMPIDYFDADFFNDQDLKTRHRIARPSVALLPNVEQSFGAHPDERLSDHLFTLKYSSSVFERYRMVSDADLEAFRAEEHLHKITEGLDHIGPGLFHKEGLGDSEGEGDWIDENESRSEDSDQQIFEEEYQDYSDQQNYAEEYRDDASMNSRASRSRSVTLIPR